jgi:hypothetical protein
MGELKGHDRLIVDTLLETGAVNFEAMGQTISRIGADSVLQDDDGFVRFCGSDMRIYKFPRPRGGLEDLAVLGEILRRTVGP